MTLIGREALVCGHLAALLSAVREPLKPNRFLENVRLSVKLTRLRIPASPSILHGVHLHGSSRFLYPASVGICLALGALLSGLPWKRLLVPIVLAGQIGLVFLNLIPWETVARESFENTRALLSVHQTFPKDDLMVVITPTDFMGAHLYGNALPYALELYVGSPFKVMALSQEQLEIAKTLSLVPRDVPTHALNRPPIHLRWPAWHPVWTALPR